MRDFSLKQLEALRAIAAAGTLNAAAKALNMTPAALTARVKALEDAFGVALFDRTPAGLKVNMAGAMALEAAAKIDGAVRDFAETMAAVSTGRGGRLSVAAISTAKYFAPRLIAAFMARHPRIELRFLIGNRAETLASLRGYEVDLALTGRPPADMAVEDISIGPHPYVMIAPPSHHLAGQRGVTKEALAGEAFLLREEGSGSRAIFDYFLGDLPISRPRTSIELGSNETIKQAVMAGLGIALISAHTIAAEVYDGRLVCLDIVGLPIMRRWYVINRADRTLSPTALAFRTFVEQRCAHFLPRLISGDRPTTVLLPEALDPGI